MSYSSETPNFDLPQWQSTDSFEMTDFNTAFSNIDEKAQPLITASGLLKGSGNGNITTASPNVDYATTRLASSGNSGLMSASQYVKFNLIDDMVTDWGTSGIWTYRKWSSGIKECWGEQTFSNININIAFGGTYYSSDFGNIAFPSGFFLSTPTLFARIQEATYGFWLMNGAARTSSTQTGALSGVRGTSANVPSVTIGYYAIGS